jgi:hypothetical protein
VGFHSEHIIIADWTARELISLNWVVISGRLSSREALSEEGLATDFDLNEIVQLNGRPVSLLNAVREIMQLPAVKRFPGLALFRDPGKQPAIFRQLPHGASA